MAVQYGEDEVADVIASARIWRLLFSQELANFPPESYESEVAMWLVSRLGQHILPSRPDLGPSLDLAAPIIVGELLRSL